MQSAALHVWLPAGFLPDSYVTQQYLDKLNVIDALQQTLVAKQTDAQRLFEHGVVPLLACARLLPLAQPDRLPLA